MTSGKLDREVRAEKRAGNDEVIVRNRQTISEDVEGDSGGKD